MAPHAEGETQLPAEMLLMVQSFLSRNNLSDASKALEKELKKQQKKAGKKTSANPIQPTDAPALEEVFETWKASKIVGSSAQDSSDSSDDSSSSESESESESSDSTAKGDVVPTIVPGKDDFAVMKW
jgi:hypothetical protein